MFEVSDFFIFRYDTWKDWLSHYCYPEFEDLCGSRTYSLELVDTTDPSNTEIPFEITEGPLYSGSEVSWKFTATDISKAGNCTQFLPGVTCILETEYQLRVVAV